MELVSESCQERDAGRWGEERQGPDPTASAAGRPGLIMQDKPVYFQLVPFLGPI